MAYKALITLAFALGLCNAALVRVCVPERAMEACRQMLKEPGLRTLNIQCVPGPDRYGCLEKLNAQAVDTTAVTGEDVFLARELYGPALQLVAEMRSRDMANEAWRYQGVAVVRRATIKGLDSLRGAKSCHTGYARTAGWNIPFSHLLKKNLIKTQCHTPGTVAEHDVKAASMFFGPSCVPGKWAPDNETDYTLKQRYSNLCALCGLPGVCDGEDQYAGYEGALSCLVEGQGDVAWSKMSAVTEFFKGRREVGLADYGLLCPDGRVLDVAASPDVCNWASRPWNGWLVRSATGNSKEVVAALTAMAKVASPAGDDATHPWAKPVMEVSKPFVIHVRTPAVSPREYLMEHKYDTTIENLGCPETSVRLCIQSKFALEKCNALRHVLKSRRIRPPLECVTPMSGDCYSMVATGDADIATADGGDIYHAYVEHNLIPVVSERYGLQDASYFAVAVVRANSSINSLKDLQGKKSCHTGIGRTAGWKIPVVTLVKAGLLDPNNCDFAGQIGNFFSSSCVPGALSKPYNKEGTNPKSLCDLCIGNNVNGSPGKSEGKCERRPIEAFSGYTGAFRCLVQGGGDVAFIKQTTVRDNTNGNNNASWAANLRATDFKLLCRYAGSADVVDYGNCHLARVPSHKVLIATNTTEVMKEEIRILLLRASQKFPQGQDVFRMFGSFKGRQDLIFKDSATQLVNVRMDKFHKSLDDAYYTTLEAMDACELKATPMHLRGTATTLSYTPSLVLSVALAWILAH